MPNLRRLVSAALLGFVPAVLAAGDTGLTASFKIRGGLTAGNVQKDLGSNKLLGMGVEVNYGLWGGSVFGEVGMTYLTGRNYVNNPYDFQAGTYFFSQGGTLGTGGASGSIDMRKNTMTGAYLRGGYRAPMGSTGWNWQGGLSLDKLKYRQEVSGTMVPFTGDLPQNGGVQSTANIEGLSVTPESSKMVAGAFVGLHTSIADEFSFEVNLVSFGYSRVNYMPSAYSGFTAPATTDTTTRRGLSLEFNFGFKF